VVQITVNVKLGEPDDSGAAKCFPCQTVKAKPGKNKPIDEDIDNPDGVVLADPVLQKGAPG